MRTWQTSLTPRSSSARGSRPGVDRRSIDTPPPHTVHESSSASAERSPRRANFRAGGSTDATLRRHERRRMPASRATGIRDSRRGPGRASHGVGRTYANGDRPPACSVRKIVRRCTSSGPSPMRRPRRRRSMVDRQLVAVAHRAEHLCRAIGDLCSMRGTATLQIDTSRQEPRCPCGRSARRREDIGRDSSMSTRDGDRLLTVS